MGRAAGNPLSLQFELGVQVGHDRQPRAELLCVMDLKTLFGVSPECFAAEQLAFVHVPRIGVI